MSTRHRRGIGRDREHNEVFGSGPGKPTSLTRTRLATVETPPPVDPWLVLELACRLAITPLPRGARVWGTRYLMQTLLHADRHPVADREPHAE